ncbi:aldo/keto reductase [Ferrovibrio sp.]|uniref:aldo/keto reductase n=1 Tax=Ferrovibrio sp. TaxID=1917215 RepID=UPI0035B07620
MTSQPVLKLNDGRTIPQIGLGVWKADDAQAAEAVRTAIAAGYRHVDTAAIYGNEAGVGEGIRSAGVKREEIFVTTKLWNDAQGSDSALKAFDASLKRLGLDYVDLYLIHWPAPRKNLYTETWRMLIRLKEQGRVKSIGVSNFMPEHLDRIIDETGIVPVLNQVELHPAFQQPALRAAHARHGIVTEAWSPLGQGKLLDNPALKAIAAKHKRTAAQVILRWHLQSGYVAIPKSVTPSRIKENFDLFNFALDAEDLAAIAKLDDKNGRIGPDPMTAAF